MSEDVPVGKPFSQVYLRPTAPLKDSKRFRNRLAAYVVNIDTSVSGFQARSLVNFLRIRLGGEELHSAAYDPVVLTRFIQNASIRDILDGITYMGAYLMEQPTHAPFLQVTRKHVADFHHFIDELLEEESLGYFIDEEFGVRYKIDIEFEQVRQASITYLGDARYQAVLHEFESAYSALEASAPDTKLAVRSIFEANEVLFRLLVGDKVKRLGSNEIGKHLLPLIEKLYGKGDPSAHVMRNLVKGLTDWVDGLHVYRHGQAVEEPSPPPIEAAVAVLQTGSAYIRLLIELDRKVHGE